MRAAVGLLAWVVSFGCLAGLLDAGGRMAFRRRTCGGGPSRLPYVVSTCMVVGAAAGIIGALT